MSFSLKSLFIKSDAIETVAAEVIEEGGKVATIRKPTKTSSRSNASEDTESEIKSTGDYDKGILKTLQQVLDDHNMDGYDYLEFRDTLSKMEKKIPDEVTRFQAAGASAEAMKCDIKSLIDTAKQYIGILGSEESRFKKAMADQEKADAVKIEELSEIEKQIRSLENKKTKILKETSESKAKMAAAKDAFYNTYNFVIAAIEKDIDKIKEYLTH